MKNTLAILAPVKVRKIFANDNPNTKVTAQKSNWTVVGFILFTPKDRAKMNIRGANITK